MAPRSSDEPLTDGYSVEPEGEGVRFIFPRRPSATGGFAAIIFGLIFAGFALFWMAATIGLADPLLEKFLGEPPLHDIRDLHSHRDFEEFDEDEEKSPTPPPLETPATEGPESPTVQPSITDQAPPPTIPVKRVRDPVTFGTMIGRIFYACFGLPFLLIGLHVISLGLLILFGHSEITLDAEHIASINRWGLLKKSIQRSTSDLVGFEIGRGPESRQQSGGSVERANAGRSHVVNAVHACFNDEKPLALASGYPLATLRPLARDLAQELQRIMDRPRVKIEEPHVHEDENDPASQGPFIPEVVPPQPTDSAAVLDQLSNGLTLRVPPIGFARAAMAPLMFGVVWCGIISVITLVMWLVDVPLPVYLILSIFWLVGLLVMGLGINIVTKQAVIDVVHDTLLLTQKGFFGRSQHEWRAEDLTDIRVDHSGTSINDKAIMNLQFIPREGRIIGLFSGRPDEELEWMAATLRVAMHMRKRD